MAEITRDTPFWDALKLLNPRCNLERLHEPVKDFFWPGGPSPNVGELFDNLRIQNGKVLVAFDETHRHFKIGGKFGELRSGNCITEKDEKLMVNFYKKVAKPLQRSSLVEQKYNPDDPSNLVMPVRNGEIEAKFREALVLDRIKRGPAKDHRR